MPTLTLTPILINTGADFIFVEGAINNPNANNVYYL